MDVNVIKTETDLKYCPLCGGNAELRYKGSKGREIRCSSCHFGLFQKVLKYPVEWLEEKLISNWNKRI